MSRPPRGFPPAEANPWKTHAVKPIYANPWFEVEEHQVTRPDGEAGIYGIVHPARIALGVVPLEADGTVWLVGQYRYPLSRYSWEIPEGGGDPDLGLVEEAARELVEETGLTAGRWDRLISMHTSNCFTSEEAVIFLARDLQPGKARPDGNEQLQLARVDLAEAVAAIARGEITDAMTIAALLELERRRLTGVLG
ncbi:MAG: NUDIX hydrolase [Xanthomonadales bacterium]|nr:NUDIX hydrolase [Xanthomonadales bacterium]